MRLKPLEVDGGWLACPVANWTNLIKSLQHDLNMVLVVVVPSSSRDYIYIQFTDPSTGRRMLYLDADDDVTPLVATTEESF